MMRDQTFELCGPGDSGRQSGAAWARQKAVEIAALDHGLEGAEPSRGGVHEENTSAGDRRYVLFNFKTVFCHYLLSNIDLQLLI